MANEPNDDGHDGSRRRHEPNVPEHGMGQSELESADGLAANDGEHGWKHWRRDGHGRDDEQHGHDGKYGRNDG